MIPVAQGSSMDLLTSMAVFVKVVDHNSFSVAAAELGISSSSVSKQVSQLESHVGARLLQRTTRRISVTEIGAAYYEKCIVILAEVDEAESLVSTLQEHPRGVLRINSNMTFGQLQLARALPEFMELYPEIRVELTLDDRKPDMIREGYDLAIRIADPQLPDSSLIARELSSIPLYTCATPAYLDKHGRPECVADLNRHNCLIFVHASSASQWLYENDDERISVQVSGDLQANNSQVIREALLADRGIANLASFVIGPYIENGDLQLLFPQYKPQRLSIFAVYPERRYTSPKVSCFIDFFKEWLEQNLQQSFQAQTANNQ